MSAYLCFFVLFCFNIYLFERESEQAVWGEGHKERERISSRLPTEFRA